MNTIRMTILLGAMVLISAGCEKSETPGAAPRAKEEKSKAQAELPGSYYYVIESEALGAEGTSSRIEYSVSGDKVAMKVYTPQKGGWKLVSHSISDGSNFYMIQHDQKMVMKMPSESGMGMGGENLQVPLWDSYLQERDEDAGVKDLGTVKIDGKKLRKKEFEDPEDRESRLVAFIDDDGLVRRTEYYDGGKLMMVQKFVEINLDPDFSGETFKPPKNYRMHDMTKVPGMEGMPGMPETE